MAAESVTSPAGAVSGGREPLPLLVRRVTAVTSLGTMMAFLDSTIVSVALQPLGDRTGSSLATVQWLVTAYLLAMAAVIPLSGWLSVRLGAKQVFLAGVTLFTAASLACGLADSTAQLIAFRALQGVGGILVPVSQALQVRAAGPRLIARVMSLSGIPVIMAPVLGPTAGGLILQHLGWRWIFLVNVPVGIVTVLLGVRLLPDTPGADPGRLDVLGLVTIVTSSVAITFGLVELGAGDAGSPEVVVPLTAGVVLLAVFVLHALRADSPLLDLRLFANRRYAAASAANFFMGALILGAVILMPLYFQVVRHESTVSTGLLLVPQGIGVALGIWRVAGLSERFGTGPVTLAGTLIGVVTTVPFVCVGAGTSYLWLGAAMTARGFGLGIAGIPAFTAAYRAVSPAKVPDATVQLSVGQRMGGSVATAVLSVVLQHRLPHTRTAAEQAESFGIAFWWVLGTGLAAALPAVFLAAAERRAAHPAPVPHDGLDQPAARPEPTT
jgi:EmrB/QacA subfamily drug resistance transporter